MTRHGQDANDRGNMYLAIEEAELAAEKKLPPFGCVIYNANGRYIGWAHGTGTDSRPHCHSEISAIAMACRRIGGLLHGCTVYSTHEPCMMCCGAICHAKISRVVWGSDRADFPELFTVHTYGARQLLQNTRCAPEVVTGVLRARCIELFAGRDRWDWGTREDSLM